MEFKPYLDAWTVIRRKGASSSKTADEYYAKVIPDCIRKGRHSENVVLTTERMWWKDERPYYNLYPAIWRALDGIKNEDISDDFLMDVWGPIAVSCPVWERPLIMCSRPMTIITDTGKELQQCVAIADSWGYSPTVQIENEDGYEMHQTVGKLQTVLIRVNKDLLAGNLAANPQADDKAGQYVRRMALVRLLARCNDVFAPHILAKDEAKYAEGTPEHRKLIEERAARTRGMRGWTVGKELEQELARETSAHLRRPHPVLLKEGKAGRTEDRLIFRKGAIVHRERVVRQPTGHMGSELQETFKNAAD